MTFLSLPKKKYAACILAALLVLISCSPRDRYVTVSGHAQGGVYSVKFNLNGHDGLIKEDVRVIKDSIDEILGAIDRSLSGYNRNSLVSRFNEGETIVPDTLFVDMYIKAFDIYDLTGGVVDAASAPLFDIWGFGFKSGKIPDDERVRNVMKDCGMNRLHRDMRSRLKADGELAPADMLLSGEALPALNYNAIAQGYSCDLVARYLKSLGVKDMLVDIGEIYCEGHNPSGQPWTLGIDSPVDGNNKPGVDLQAVFMVPQGAHGVVTSGNYRKFYVREGKKYAHTIDPRMGCPVSHNLLSATIIAPDGITADVYATYCMVVGLEESKTFLEAAADLEGCLIYDDDGEFRIWTTSGFELR